MQVIVDTLNSKAAALQLQVEDLQATNGTISILMYLATFLAVIFVVTTVSIIVIVVKRKKTTSEEAPLY
jgi:hypothetical protein